MENNNIKQPKQPTMEQPKQPTMEQPKQPTMEQPKQPKIEKSDLDKWNERMFRQGRLRQSVEGAKEQGMDPQSVFDSVAKQNNIGNGHEDYDTLKKYAFEDAKQGPDGKYQYRKYNIGSNKLLQGDERSKMERLAKRLNDAGYKSRLVDGWEDYGGGMKWSNILGSSSSPLNLDYWALDPKQWLDYMNDDVSEDDIIEQIRQRNPDDFVTNRSKNKALNSLYGLNDDPSQDIDITDDEVNKLVAGEKGGTPDDLYRKVFGDLDSYISDYNPSVDDYEEDLPEDEVNELAAGEKGGTYKDLYKKIFD